MFYVFFNELIFKISFGCTGSPLLCEWGLLSSCGAQASYCGGLSCYGAQALCMRVFPGVKPRLIQGIRCGYSVGEDQETNVN